MLKVVKFGGSSLASAEQFKKVKKLLQLMKAEDMSFLLHLERDFQVIQRLPICCINAIKWLFVKKILQVS